MEETLHLRSFDDDDYRLERPYAFCGANGADLKMRNLLSLINCPSCLARAKKLGLKS